MAQSFIAMDAPRHTRCAAITLEAFKPGNMRPPGGLDPRPRPRPDRRDGAPRRGRLRRARVRPACPARIFGEFFGLEPGSDLHAKAVNAAGRVLAWTDPEVCGDLDPARAVRRLGAGAARRRRRARRGAPREARRRPASAGSRRPSSRASKMTDFEIGSFFVLLAVAAQRHDAARVRARDQRADQASRPARAADRGRRRDASTPRSRRSCAGRRR